MEKLKLKLKQPLSLRWKWGIFLFICFSLFGTLGSIIIQHQVEQRQLQFYRQEQQLLFDQTREYMGNMNLPFNEHLMSDESKEMNLVNPGRPQAYLLRFIRFLEKNEIAMRLLDLEGNPIYVSEHLGMESDLPKDQLTRVIHDGKPLLVGRAMIYSLNLDTPLGYLDYVVDSTGYYHLWQNQKRILLISIAISIVVALILALYISDRFLRPLTYLNNALNLVEEENISDIRVRKPRSNDEWSDLSLHVNKLLDKIDLYVTNQKQFVEDVSHELRTPVAIVEGHLKLLNRWGKDDPEVLEESIAASLQEITRMKSLVAEMLDLSRADHVDVDYKDEVTEILSTTRQVFHNFQLIHPDFYFNLDIEGKGDTPLYVRMYRDHYEQILIILLDNAVKYSTDRPEVHISVSSGLNKVEVAIQDFGEGMSDEDKERVFSRFYRVDKARSREKGGNGLGLSIARQLIHTYRGDIRVESALNHGSIFYVELPLLKDDSLIKQRLESSTDEKIGIFRAQGQRASKADPAEPLASSSDQDQA